MASDSIVTAKLVLQAQLELQRLGAQKVLALLEQTEPDLTEYLLESSTVIYHQILQTGVSSRQARRIHQAIETLVLVCLRALQQAHQALWQESTGQELSARLQSPPGTAAAPEPNSSPPAS